MTNPRDANAVVLLSGGLDSATCLAIARDRGLACHCLSFDYGQRHRFELEAAGRLAAAMGAASHATTRMDLAAFGGSSLTDDAIETPKGRSAGEMESGIPVTYVPARNLVFLSIASAFAETVGAGHIVIGVNAIDYSGYPDCRPAFIEAFERAANLATRDGIEGRPVSIDAPLIAMTKAEIIQTGRRLGVDYALTHSCYDPSPDGAACGACDACLLRRNGFADAGVADPTRYAPAPP